MQNIRYGRKKAKVFLTLFSITSLAGSLMMIASIILRIDGAFNAPLARNLNLHQVLQLLGIAAKCLGLIPFIAFEYYLILFRHLFVDASHYMSALSQRTFLIS